MGLMACAVAASAPPPPSKPKLAADAPVLLVAIHDARPYIVSGENKETFVGYSRSLYGIPYHEDLKIPLATVLGRPMVEALREKGFRARIVEVSPFKPAIDKIRPLARSAVLVELTEWKTDKLIHTTLAYDVTLKLLASTGEELASAHLASQEEYIGGKQRAERQTIDATIKDIFSTLLEGEAVQKGLEGIRTTAKTEQVAASDAAPAEEKTSKDAWADCKATVKSMLPSGTQVSFPPYADKFLKEHASQRFLFTAQVYQHLERGKLETHTWRCEATYLRGQLVEPVAYLDPSP
jgi:hypothetical protein